MKQKEWISNEAFAQNIRIQLPVMIAEGDHPGATAFVCAAQHGRELHGFAAISQIFDELSVAELHGTVIFVPAMNPLGVRMRVQDILDELPRSASAMRSAPVRNMNRLWEFEKGSDSVQSILVEQIYERYISRADAVLDIHGWSSGSAGWTTEACMPILRKFGLRMFSSTKEDSDGMLVTRARRDGKDAYTVEIEPQSQVVADGFQLACRIIRNMLKAYGMIPGELELPAEQFIRDPESDVFLEAPVSGIAVPLFRDQEVVPAGSEYLRILSVDTGETLWRHIQKEEMLNVYAGRYYLGPGREPTSFVEKGMNIAHLTKLNKVTNPIKQ